MNIDPAAALAEAERAAAAPFVNRRPTPLWLTASWAIVIGADLMLVGLDNTLFRVLGLVVVLFLIGVLIGSAQRVSGPLPRFSRTMPPEFRSIYVAYYIGAALLLALAITLSVGLGHPVLAGAVTIIGMVAILLAYESKDRQAAAKVRARLGMPVA